MSDPTDIPEPTITPESAAVETGESRPSATEGEASAAPEPSGEPGDPGASQEGGAGAAPIAAGAKAAKEPRRRPRDPGIARAFRAGIPVEGHVERVIKGGYEVRVGKSRGFCPHSQMDVARVENPEEHVGRSYSFRIVQMRRGGDDVVVSRRALLEEARGEEAKAVRATLIEGGVMQGRVARLADFGAFVDLGAGVTGLVHVSEMGPGRVVRVADAAKVGDRVTVKILKLDESTGRISLSLRQAQEDAWPAVEERFLAGRVYPGRVVRMADFGAFVEMEKGIEALAPAREFPPSPGGWRDGIEVGLETSWLVLSVEPGRRRMSVIPAPAGGGVPSPVVLEAGARLAGRVQKVEKFGVFVWLGPGQVGLVPNVWTGTPRGTDLSRQFPPGKEVSVTVVEVAEQGKRIRLAIGDAAEARSAEDLASHGEERRPAERRREPARDRPVRAPAVESAEPQPPPPSFGTSLGDALKSAFEKRDGRG